MANSRKLTATILSISLLTVMAGAAIAPALGIIKAHFAGAPDILIQLIVSMPALFIILTNFAFPALSRRFDTKTLALSGLLMYVVFGAGGFLVDSLWALLVLRALLGVSVGLIMPLSTGLLSYYYSPEEQAGLMGLSAAMNQLGGVVATLLAGLLANVQWNYGFLVYLLGLIAVVLVILYLPADHIGTPKVSREDIPEDKKRLSRKAERSVHPEDGTVAIPNGFFARVKRFHPSVVGMLLVMIIFFVFPTNFAIAAHAQTTLSNNAITLIMVGLDVVAFLVGLVFGAMMQKLPRSMKYMPPVFFFLGYLLYCIFPTMGGFIIGSVFIGIANGIGVPYLNTIASIKAGKHAATTVMPLLSMALYLGQFTSPLIVTPAGKLLFGQADVSAPFKIACIFCVIFLLQVYMTRRFQSLPPKKA
jgi:MFS family permease